MGDGSIGAQADPTSSPGADAAAAASFDLLRRRVLNVVGHELRTPVTTLRGLAELLGTVDDPQRADEVHEAIKRSARRMEALLDDALVALGVATALPVGEPEPVAVAGAVAEACAGIGHGSAHTEGDAVVLVHPEGFRRALACLLDNAMKYGGDRQVDVRIGIEGNHAVVTITDHGAGIGSAEADLVFEPFFRGERAVMTAPGLGLGLAVARRLVEHDDGSVDLRTLAPEARGGAVATVRVPVAPSEDAASG